MARGAIFSDKEAAWAAKAINAKASVKEPKQKINEGRSVKIVSKKSRHKDVIGVVRKYSMGMYWVEPYNDAYWNDPRSLSYMGPFSESELKAVRKPRGASTEFKEKKHPHYQDKKNLLTPSEVAKMAKRGTGETKKKTKKKGR